MVNKKKYAILVLFLGLCLIVTVLLASPSNHPFAEYNVESPDDAARFLAELGWECDINGITAQQSMLPEEFDSVLTDYNTLQLKQGCDLMKYAGKEITIYTAPILNYSDSTENIYATIIVHNHTVIGGDIHSADLNGFMHTLC